MRTTNTRCFFYSVKGTTEKLVREMGETLGNATYASLTKESVEKSFGVDDLVIVGAPVYGGRIPQNLAKRLEKLHGNKTPAVAVVVYGNRAYEDALLELKNILSAQNFVVIAALVFVAEHSLAPTVATGRPNSRDLEIAQSYAAKITEKLVNLESFAGADMFQVPGNFPYMKPSKEHKIESDDMLNPLLRKIANLLLPHMFKGEKQPEIYL